MRYEIIRRATALAMAFLIVLSGIGTDTLMSALAEELSVETEQEHLQETVLTESETEPGDAESTEYVETRSPTEIMIDISGGAYVRSGHEDIPVYAAASLKDLQGTLPKSGSLLYADAYRHSGSDRACLHVYFATDNGTVEGWVSEKDLSEKRTEPVAMREAKGSGCEVWLDSTTDFPAEPVEYIVEPEAEETYEAEPTVEPTAEPIKQLATAEPAIEPEEVEETEETEATVAPEQTAEPTSEPEIESTEKPENTEEPETVEEPEPAEESEITDEPEEELELIDDESEASPEPEIEEEQTSVYTLMSSCGVTVSFSAEAIPEGIQPENVELQAVPVELSAEQLGELAGEGMQVVSYTAYDVTLIDGATGAEFEPIGNVSVTIPSAELEDEAFHIVDGDVNEVSSTYEDGCHQLEVDHFSIVLTANTAPIEYRDLTVQFSFRIDEGYADAEVEVHPENVVFRLQRTTQKDYSTELVWEDCADAEGRTSISLGSAGQYSPQAIVTVPDTDSAGNEYVYRVVPEDISLYTYTVTDPFESQSTAAWDITDYAVEYTFTNQNWNYLLDLKWDTRDVNSRRNWIYIYDQNGSPNLKYQLSISTNAAYKAGDLNVRVPRLLFRSRDGKTTYTMGANNMQVSVPLAPNTNVEWPFNYSVDPETDELVFTNWTDIDAGTKLTITVSGTVSNDQNVADFSYAELKATGSATVSGQTTPEKLETEPISVLFNSGVQNVAISMTGNYSTPKPVYSMNDLTMFGNTNSSGTVCKPTQLDTENYHYFVYQLTEKDWNAQTNKVTIAIEPSDGGEVVGWQDIKHETEQVPVPDDNGEPVLDGEGNPTYTQKEGFTYTVLGNNTRNTYFLIRYPIASDDKTERADGITVYSHKYGLTKVTMTAVGTDEHEGDKGETDTNDVKSTTYSYAGRIWEDIQFSWPIHDLTVNKSLTNFVSAGALILQRGDSVTGTATFNTNHTGYKTWLGTHTETVTDEEGNETEVSVPNTYTYVLEDDLVEIAATAGTTTHMERVRLHEGEYRFENARVTISCKDLDPTTGGSVYDNITEGEFVLQGKTSLDGEHGLRMNATSAYD